MTVVAGLVAAACAPGATSEARRYRAYPSPGTAEAALTTFGVDNRACRMWTNWQSLCARTGPGGSAQCKQDPGFRAEASEPFCVNWRVPEGRTYSASEFDTPAQHQSRNRFCDVFAGAKGSRRKQAGATPECDLYAPKRPFDGRRAEALTHPLCRKWRQTTPDGAVVLGPAACVEWANPLPCPRVQANAYRYPDKSTIMMPTVQDYRSQPVWGVFCIEGD